MTRGSPRTARARRGSSASTRGRWGRSATARSVSRCTRWAARGTDRLAWRQFVVLAVFAGPPEEQRIVQRDVARDEGHAAGPTGGLRQEVEELATLGLL